MWNFIHPLVDIKVDIEEHVMEDHLEAKDVETVKITERSTVKPKKPPLMHHCDHCEYKSIWVTHVRRHMKSVHKQNNEAEHIAGDENDPLAINKKEDIEYKQESKEKFSSEEQTEISTVKKKLKHKCDECDYSSPRPGRVAKHKKIVHGGEQICNKCDHKSSTFALLKQHKDEVHKKEIKCSDCDKVFSRLSRLTKHMELYHWDKEYLCHKCDFITKAKLSLYDHIKLKHGEKTHFCDQCSYSSKYWTALRNHKETHEGIEKPCHFCGVTYTRTVSLKRHIKTAHEGKGV